MAEDEFRLGIAMVLGLMLVLLELDEFRLGIAMVLGLMLVLLEFTSWLGAAMVVLLEFTSELSPAVMRDRQTKVLMPAMSFQSLGSVHKSQSSKQMRALCLESKW